MKKLIDIVNEFLPNTYHIGVVGYSDQIFDETLARKYLEEAFEAISRNNRHKEIIIVSGLTNIGIPKIAYNIAVENHWWTVGIACSKADEYEIFPCDQKIIVGKNWGDETEVFLNSIDCLVKVGGGKQSEKEFELAEELNIPTLEYKLEGE
jgi:hypothetical protein